MTQKFAQSPWQIALKTFADLGLLLQRVFKNGEPLNQFFAHVGRFKLRTTCDQGRNPKFIGQLEKRPAVLVSDEGFVLYLKELQEGSEIFDINIRLDFVYWVIEETWISVEQFRILDHWFLCNLKRMIANLHGEIRHLMKSSEFISGAAIIRISDAHGEVR
jgi:hypothetical protein